MTDPRPRTYATISVAIVLAAVIVAASILATSNRGQTLTKTMPEITTTTQITTVTVTPTSTSTTITLPTAASTTTISTLSSQPPCYPAGESGPFGLRILFDSNQSPVAGAQVRATNQPATVSCNGSSAYPLTSQTIVYFTTNNTEWYYLDSGPDAGYSIVVTYQGQQYNLTATFHPEYAYCATLLIASGKMNSTGTEFQTTCS